MQKVDAPVVLVRINDEFVIDRDRFRRAVLADAVKVNFDAAKIEMKHRRHPLYAFDHASGNDREEQLRRIGSVRPGS